MGRISKSDRWAKVHQEAVSEFSRIQNAMHDERQQCVLDRRFYSIAGGMWDEALADQFENRPKFEVNKAHLSVMRLISEYRNNRVTVDFVSKTGAENDELAEACDALYRADEQDSCAEEAYDNAFEEAAGGGFGAFRLRTCYEDEYDDEREEQRIRIEPIFDADTSVWFDLGAKRQDKSDARCCYVLYGMDRTEFTEKYGEAASMQKLAGGENFDWVTADTVYVAEYYKVEERAETIHYYRAITGEEEKYTDADFEADATLQDMLIATGSTEVRTRQIKRRQVRKYLLTGDRILEDLGYIAGKNIPIVPVYGKRWFVDGIERCMGNVRLVKDSARLKNMQVSMLASISAMSPVGKPIVHPEQMQGFQTMWEEDNRRNYPYLLLNPMRGPNGETMPGGPVAYTQPAQIPPALGALLQMTEQDMSDILGSNQQAEKVVSGVSGKAVEMIQSRLDMQSFIFMSNFAKAMRRCGEIWLGMAREVYVEVGRKMKGVGAAGDVTTVEIAKPSLNEETGETKYENDISDADFDVIADVGPSFTSRRDATVRALTGMMQVTTDPESQLVMQSMAMMNMEGEGLGEVRDYFRRRLVQIGAIKPSEEEAQEMAQAAQGQAPDANTVYLQSEAAKSQAMARKADAETELTLAKVEQTRADTLGALSEIDQIERQAAIDTARFIGEMAQPAPVPNPMGDEAAAQPLMSVEQGQKYE